jgi:uncharacterized coiled-coil protein SlyX
MSGYNIKAIDAELECLNERIADRNATIASQAAQIERLTDLLAVERVRSHMLAEDLAALQPKEGEG